MAAADRIVFPAAASHTRRNSIRIHALRVPLTHIIIIIPNLYKRAAMHAALLSSRGISNFVARIFLKIIIIIWFLRCGVGVNYIRISKHNRARSPQPEGHT